ncbi:hypothetical protein [Silvimonas iriomotensis]|uniref:Uncharacterized protein n=1 Tax=Silvimonas iriomotensis TaxID=449662 RepID=A0ABQ2P4A9_9NEIS|nr:hypothetical protein [Silvimonas iriomotensis]GGP17891.1 hypothetical protein GCM10010970_02070 [Silvimonas iriomotensis]
MLFEFLAKDMCAGGCPGGAHYAMRVKADNRANVALIVGSAFDTKGYKFTATGLQNTALRVSADAFYMFAHVIFSCTTPAKQAKTGKNVRTICMKQAK